MELGENIMSFWRTEHDGRARVAGQYFSCQEGNFKVVHPSSQPKRSTGSVGEAGFRAGSGCLPHLPKELFEGKGVLVILKNDAHFWFTTVGNANTLLECGTSMGAKLGLCEVIVMDGSEEMLE